MTPAPTPPLPGAMTVPPLFGWEHVLLVVVLAVVVGVVVLAFTSTGGGTSERSDWQGWLDARSRPRPDGPAAPGPRGVGNPVAD